MACWNLTRLGSSFLQLPTPTAVAANRVLIKVQAAALAIGLPQKKIADQTERFTSAENPTEGESGDAVQRASRQNLVRAGAAVWYVSKAEKAQILGHVCAVRGHTRKYALTLLKTRHRTSRAAGEQAIGPGATEQPRWNSSGYVGW